MTALLTAPPRSRPWRHVKLARAAAQLKDRARQYLGCEKQGTIGGDNETQFEATLAQLGWTYMQDAAPELLDFLVGFQLVERNNDNTKAVGVFGFQIGRAWIYAPIFFLNGEVKGNELLYLKDQDLFVPLDQAWVKYVISQQQQPELGFPAHGTARELGVLQPNILPLSRPQYLGALGKYSAVYPNVPTAGWLSPSAGFRGVYSALTLEGLEKAASAGLGAHLQFSLGSVLEAALAASPALCKAALVCCDAYPAVEHYLYQFHGPRVLERALVACQTRLEKAAAVAASPLTELAPAAPATLPPVQLRTAPHPHMSPKAAQELASRGYAVEDSRPQEKLSQALLIKTPQRFANPAETGLYDLLTKPGELRKCLIILAPKGADEAAEKAIVIDLAGGDRRWFLSHPANLFVNLPGYSSDDFEQWFVDQPAGELAEDGTYVLLSPQRGASVPFEVHSRPSDTLYEVRDKYYGGYDTPDYLRPNFRDGGPARGVNSRGELRLVHWDRERGQGFNFFGGELRVSRMAKALRLSRFAEKFVPAGSPVDAELAIQSKTAGLRLWVDEFEGSLNRGRPQSKLACLWALVETHGFDAETAQELLKLAEARGRTGDDLRVRVLYGPGYPQTKAAAFETPGGSSLGLGSIAPGIPEPVYAGSAWTPRATEQYPLAQALPIDGIGARYTDPSVWDNTPQAMPDPMLMQMAQQAGQSGQKELFDTNMLTALLKNVRQGSLLQSFTPDLMKALDRLGRILFLFYWHNNDFADRYGKNDLPELEDATRNAFETLGELVLFLKERDVEPLAAQQRGEANVEAVSE